MAATLNCVDEVRADAFWGRHMDAFAGASRAGDFANQANANKWIVDGSPEVGDVAVWAPNQAGASAEGHVGVIVSVSAKSFSVHERNWPEGSPTHVRSVTRQGGISFVHHRAWLPSGYHTEQYVSGYRSEQYISGYHSQQYISGYRNEQYITSYRGEQYISGYRTEWYQSGWKDHWVFRNWHLVNDRQPVYSSRQVAVYATRQVPVYGTRQVAMYATRQVPVYDTRQVAIYATRQVPTAFSVQTER